MVVHPKDRFVYVSDASSATLSVVDTLSFMETARIALPSIPKGIGINLDGTFLYSLTSVADSVSLLGLADPGAPMSDTALSLGTSGVSLDSMAVFSQSGGDLLALASRSGQSLYLFDREAGALRSSGSDDHVSLGFEPLDVRFTPDGARVVVLGSAGEFRTYLTSNLTQTGSSIDLSSFTSTSLFSQLLTATVGAGTFGFISNATTPGEVLLVNMVSSSHTVFVQDVDPTSVDTTEPFYAGNGASGTLVATVPRASGQADATGTYLFVANRFEDSMSVFDTAKIGGTENISALATILGIADVPARGLAASSATEGFVYAANTSGSALTVVSDQPFLALGSYPTDPITSGDVPVTVQSTKAGTVSAYIFDQPSTEAISKPVTGSLATESIAANTDTVVTIAAADLAEGSNTIVFFVEGDGLRGRTAVNITKDTPPPTPENFDLSFGNGKIFARWSAVEVADVSHYFIYFGVTSADGGVGGLESPIRVEAGSGGTVEATISPVPNGTTIYARVVAVDENGNQSDPTETLSEIAEETIGILGFSGEIGSCRSVQVTPLFLALLILVFARGRRRRRLVLLAVFGILTMTPKSDAQTIQEANPILPARTSVEVNVGWLRPKDPALKRFLGTAGNEVYSLRFGLLVDEFDFGFQGGILSEKARLIGVSTGRTSGESSRVTLVPIEFSGQYSLRLGKRPIVVPFGRVGYDLNYYKVSEPTTSASGTKHGLSLGGGLRFMLERFATGDDMSDLLGIRHFFLEAALTYRVQFSSGLDFGGLVFGPGLGVEF